MKARNIVFHTKRDPYNRQYDRITIHMVHEGFGLVYQAVMDHKGCQVGVMPDVTPQKVLPATSPLEKQHAQEAKARALYSLHHWAQHLRGQYDEVMSYMKGEGAYQENPMTVASRGEIEDKEAHCLATCIWITVNPMIHNKITGDRISFTERMRIIAKMYELPQAIEAHRKGFKINDYQKRLIRAYCDALKMDGKELSEWLMKSED